MLKTNLNFVNVFVSNDLLIIQKTIQMPIKRKTYRLYYRFRLNIGKSNMMVILKSLLTSLEGSNKFSASYYQKLGLG